MSKAKRIARTVTKAFNGICARLNRHNSRGIAGISDNVLLIITASTALVSAASSLFSRDLLSQYIAIFKYWRIMPTNIRIETLLFLPDVAAWSVIALGFFLMCKVYTRECMGRFEVEPGK